jgi:hypothetical protein
MKLFDFVKDLCLDWFVFQILLAWSVPMYVVCERFAFDYSTMGIHAFDPNAVIPSVIFLFVGMGFMSCAVVTANLLVLLPFYFFDELVQWIQN